MFHGRSRVTKPIAIFMRPQRSSILIPVGFVSLLMGAWAFGPVDPQDAEIVPQHVTGPVYMLTGAGGNLGVSVGPDGVLLIDDQFASMSIKIKAALETLAKGAELSTGTPRLVLNTHHHGDHTGGNEDFGADSIIVAHQNVREQLLNRIQGGPMPAVGLPVVTYEDGLSLHFNGEELRLVHLPEGHTNGDTVVFFTGSNVVHTGDLCFNGLFPFIDLDGGGSVRGFHENIGAILEATDENTRFIPGHGPLATWDDLMACQSTLGGVIELVAEALKEGKTGQQMKDAKLLAEYDSWSWAFISSEKMIDTVVRELSAD
jgi:cyclase